MVARTDCQGEFSEGGARWSFIALSRGKAFEEFDILADLASEAIVHMEYVSLSRAKNGLLFSFLYFLFLPLLVFAQLKPLNLPPLLYIYLPVPPLPCAEIKLFFFITSPRSPRPRIARGAVVHTRHPQ